MILKQRIILLLTILYTVITDASLSPKDKKKVKKDKVKLSRNYNITLTHVTDMNGINFDIYILFLLLASSQATLVCHFGESTINT